MASPDRIRTQVHNQWLEPHIDFCGGGIRFLKRQSVRHPRTFVSDMTEPRIVEHGALLIDKLSHLVADWYPRFNAPGFQDYLRNRLMTCTVAVYAIRRNGECGILLSLQFPKGFDRSVQVDHHFNAVLLFQNPLSVFLDDLIVAFVRCKPGELVAPLRSQLSLSLKLQRIKRRRRHQDQFCPGGMNFFDQSIDAVLIFLETFFVEWIVNSIVHTIAGHHDIGFNCRECSVKSLVDIGTRKRVIRLRKSCAALTWKSGIYEFRHRVN